MSGTTAQVRDSSNDDPYARKAVRVDIAIPVYRILSVHNQTLPSRLVVGDKLTMEPEALNLMPIA